MGKYSSYRYSELLEFLEFRYKSGRGGTNYASILIGMKNAKSIESLIKTYNTIYLTLLEYLNTRKHTGHKDYDEDLNTCFNESLITLFEKEKNPTLDTCLMYLSNIRECPYIEEYQSCIIEKSLNKHGRLFEGKAKSIVLYLGLYNKAYREFLYTHYEPGSNGYNKQKENVKMRFDQLVSYGYKRTLADFGHDSISLTTRFAIFAAILFAIFFIYVLYFA